MGGAIALMVAAAVPERIERVVLFDSVGSLSRDPKQALSISYLLLI